MSTERSRRRKRVGRLPWILDGVLAVILGTLLLLAARGGSGPAPAAPTGAPGARESEYLARRLELATHPSFHLLLDVPRSRLLLACGGARLQEYPILSVETGMPRFPRLRGAAPAPDEAVWPGGTLSPPRLPSPALRRALGDGGPGEIPPLPDAAFPSPPVWHVRFGSGLDLRIEAVPGTWTPGERIGEAWRSLREGFRRHPAVRMRVGMAPEEAGRLYRALPIGASLLVVTEAWTPPRPAAQAALE